MTSIAVTGATGLIGSAVVARLSPHATVARIGRSASSDLIADFSKPESVAGLDLSGFDAVVHCAGIVDEDFAQAPQQALTHAIHGSNALVQAAKRGGVRRLAMISSAHVYGPMVGHKDEDSEIDPRSDYAIAHFATEQVFRRAAPAFEAVGAFRPCAVFGTLPHPAAFRRWTLVPFSFPRNSVEAREIALQSDGVQRRNFVGSDDIAGTIAIWLKDESKGFNRFNPVGASDLSVWEFAQLCAQRAETVLGVSVKTKRREGPPSGDAPFVYATRHDFCRGDASLVEHIDQMLLLAAAMAQDRTEA